MKKGFSLIEMLIYISLLAIVGVLIINSMLYLAPSYNSLKVTRDINNAAVATIERITREVRSARNVDTINSIFEESEGKIVLNTATSTVSMYLSNGRVYLQEGVQSPSPLTRGNIIVTGLVFEHFVGTQSEVVQLSITIEGNERTFVKNETFYTSAVLRNLYTLGSTPSEEAPVVEEGTPPVVENDNEHSHHHRGHRHHHGRGGGNYRLLQY